MKQKFTVGISSILLIILSALYVLQSLSPKHAAAPTSDWCRWAFAQLPDHKSLSEIDKSAFSTEFYAILEKAFTSYENEIKQYPDGVPSGEFLTYWYDGNGDSIFDDKDLSLRFLPSDAVEGTAAVNISAITPSLGFRDKPLQYRMDLVYEYGAWRIDDWENLTYSFGGTMRDSIERYLEQ